MKKLYVVTGADGHLGSTLIRLLLERGERVRGLILPGQTPLFADRAEYVRGDVTNPQSLLPLFADREGAELILIHTAGIISIADKVTDDLVRVNVEGTKNLLALSLGSGVKKFVYVSSVHAIPEQPLRVLSETDSFSPDKVQGAYAKTKAMATEAVLEYVGKGLNAVIVQPSGILGPYDESGNHLVQLVTDYVENRLPACVRGGYDFVDVRDVAAARWPRRKRERRANATFSPTAITRSGKCSTSRARWRAAQAARAARLDGKAGAAADGVYRQMQKETPAVYEIFPLHPFEQRQIFSRQGLAGAGLPPPRPVRNHTRHHRLAQTQKIPLARLTAADRSPRSGGDFFVRRRRAAKGRAVKPCRRQNRNRFSYFPVKDKAATYRGVF